MQQDINLYVLLPERRGAFPINAKSIGIISGVFFLILLIQSFFAIWRVHHLNQAIDTMQHSLLEKQTMLQKLIVQLPNDLMIKRALKTKEASQKAAGMNYAHFSDYLVSFSQAIITDVWLTEMVVDLNMNQVNIKGHSLSANAVQAFIAQLRKQNSFQKIPLGLEEIDKQGSLYNFTISYKAT